MNTNHLHPLMLVSLTLGLTSACSNQFVQEVTQADTACTANMAQIEVGDGYMRALCGCSESSSEPVITPASLTCTVPAGTQVLFQYSTTTLKHQIVPTGDRSFPPSPLSDPSDESMFMVHAVLFDNVGTYSFIDNVNHAIQGQIIVL